MFQKAGTPSELFKWLRQDFQAYSQEHPGGVDFQAKAECNLAGQVELIDADETDEEERFERISFDVFTDTDALHPLGADLTVPEPSAGQPEEQPPRPALLGTSNAEVNALTIRDIKKEHEQGVENAPHVLKEGTQGTLHHYADPPLDPFQDPREFPEFEKADFLRVSFVAADNDSHGVTCPDLYPLPEKGARTENAQISDRVVKIKLGTELSRAQRLELLQLCAKNVSAFVRPPGPFTPADVAPLHIDTGDSPPVRAPYRRIPAHLREVVETETREMLANNVIERSTGSWSSNILLVRKPSGKYRFVCDYRKVNAACQYFGGKIPEILSILDALRGGRIFSTVDLQHGFWQCSISEESRDITSFVTHEGQYRFRVLPFGIRSAPHYFQDIMREVIEDLPNVQVYLDDLIIHSDSFESHVKHLRDVFSRLQKRGLYCQPAKVNLGFDKLKFLGHVISADGIEVDPSKTDAIRKIIPPKNKKALRSFLGIAGWYRRYCKDYSGKSLELYRLTGKDAEFKWEAKHQKAFDQLKHDLCTAPMLHYPDFSGKFPFVLQVDSSDHTVGCVLSQKGPDGKDRVISYASEKLPDQAARVWHIRDKEAYACVWGILKHRYFLLNSWFLVETDHESCSSVRWILREKVPPKLAR